VSSTITYILFFAGSILSNAECDLVLCKCVLQAYSLITRLSSAKCILAIYNRVLQAIILTTILGQHDKKQSSDITARHDGA
jgi:hypothetical protein